MKFILYIGMICSVFVCQAQTGTISTIAGNGFPHDTGDGVSSIVAGLCLPNCSSAIDNHGNYYIIQRFCYSVRKVSASGVITHFAGTGARGYSGDGGPASAAMLNDPGNLAIDDSGNVYISDLRGARIRKVDINTLTITTFAGNGSSIDSGDGGPATAAAINGAAGTCFDKNGNMYIVTSSKIRRVDAVTHFITTIAGTGTAGFSGDGGPATAAQLSPADIAIDTFKNIFISDPGNGRIRRVDASTGIITTIAGYDGGASYNGDGIPAIAARLRPFGLKFDSKLNLYIADNYNNRIRKISPSGIISTVAGTGAAGFSGDGGIADSAEIYGPWGVAIDDCDNLMFADGQNYRIRKITFPASNAPTINITAATGNNPCYGMPVTFTAHTALAGSTPTYQWKVNGMPTGSSAPTYTYTPANGDSVQCVITSSLYCVINPRDTSNVLHMAVGSNSVPVVTVSGDTVKGAGATVNLSATITGAGGSYTLQWRNHGAVFATTITPSVTYIKAAGTDSITATLVSSARGCYDSMVSGVHIVWDHNVEVASLARNDGEVLLWPNPVGDELFIDAPASIGSVVITNVLGQEVYQVTPPSPSERVGLRLDIPPGVYFVRVACPAFSGGSVYSGKFVKR